jgi:hemerythrin
MRKSLFVWDAEKYSIHVDKMDEEHKELVRLMNELYVQHSEKAAPEIIRGLVYSLGTAIELHFADEEAFFKKIPNYIAKEAHVKIHVDLLKRYKEHVAVFERDQKLTSDFFNFLKIWLIAHIGGVDMKYGELASNKPA